jgi:molybdopterin-binding protein
MNQFRAVIKSVRSEGSMSLVSMDADGLDVHAVLIDTPVSAPWLMDGAEVRVRIKETEVVIARDWSGHISMRNRWPAVVGTLQTGALLTSVMLFCGGRSIVSLITTQSAKEMALKPGDKVTAFVKTNEISIALP